jgi:hypothetical protein
MHRFHVYEACKQGQEIALADEAGRFHVARISGDPPPIGTELDGPLGNRGLERFRCTTTGQLFRVAFVELDCDRQATLERLHPQVTR